jgi:short-subunit dehydrogenase
MSAKFSYAGCTAVVTGAASGIGAALARTLADRGCHLALADINTDGLQSVADELSIHDRRVTTHILDVGNRDAIYDFAADVEKEHHRTELLFNNAGVATMGTFEQVEEQDFEWLLNINLLGPIRMTRAFLPLLRQASTAHIINISSIFGVIAPPGQTAYCTSKFGLLGFSDSLRHEFDGSSIGVTTVHPGGIDTNIASSSRTPKHVSSEEAQETIRSVEQLLVMPPSRAASIILDAVERGRPRVYVGSDAKRMAFIQRLFPFRYWSLIQRSIDSDKRQIDESGSGY